MVFSSTSDKAGIVEDIDFLLGTDSTSYALTDKARNVNRWYYRVGTWIWNATRRWEFDDSNLTTHPIATTTLVADQQDYSLPTTALKLIGVSVKNSSGDFYKLLPFDQSDTTLDRAEFMDTSGLPQYYDLVGDAIFLYPAPASGSVTLSAGLKIYFLREFDAFASTDTTQEPGFSENFHRLLSYGGSLDFCLANAPAFNDKASAFRQEIELMKRELEKFYGGRNDDERVNIVPRSMYRTGSYE